MLVLNLLPEDFHCNSWHLFGLTLWFSFISWYARLSWNKRGESRMQEASLSEQIYSRRESFNFFGLRISNNLGLRLATIWANVSVALGKVQETRVWVLAWPLASCVTLKLHPPRWARVSYLQDGELDEVTFPAFWLWKALILWSPWVFLTLKPHHCKRSKDERLSAHGGQITSLKANACFQREAEGELTVAVASEFKMSWSSECCHYARPVAIALVGPGFLFTVGIFCHH